jgi:hypothetical protein
MREGAITPGTADENLQRAVDASIISNDEAELVRKAEQARAAYTTVDAFTLEEYDGLRLGAQGEPDSMSAPLPREGSIAAEGDGVR